ncbi:right-handed parallel beta-helix repeat-containing protein [Halogeometricum sp. S1BR25-6]|uniref:Right-handed parallel beta-helix repeat-containing protein n=1 Tax=Halogeometricum salsisoli TaxID=2950536 RepID=A0ABU2GCE0_9EURY|nr:right-handed parallel beta-helix repeat-containing protein [Halogeometricum sp. S1BR25-6]MDS0298475.1 right-handed parallel beta-helix repeat-containing protein [Halogeometricum sp. S1BR25-6]
MEPEGVPSRRDVLKAGAAAAGLAAWGSFPAAAAGATEISGPTTITEPGDYVLTADIDVERGPAALDVTVSDVTIDGQGHTVSNVGGECISVYRGANDVTVKNVRVSGERTGVVLVGDDATLFNVLAEGNGGTGVRIIGGKRARIESCLLRENGQYGLIGGDTQEYGSTDEALVRACLVADNGDAGLAFQRTTGVAVERCFVVGNGAAVRSLGDGVEFIGDTDDPRLADNQLLSNAGCGVRGASRGVRGLNAVGNVVVDNERFGFWLDNLYNADIKWNTFARNEGGLEAYATDSRVLHNQFVDDDFGGIYTDSTVRGNRIIGGRMGGGDFIRSVVVENLVLGADDDGVSLVSMIDSEFGSNTVIGCGGDGVKTAQCYGCDVQWNTFSNNAEEGFSITWGSDSTFKFNTVFGNGGDGLKLSASEDEPGAFVVRKNTVSANGGVGILLRDAAGSRVTRNVVCANDRGIAVSAPMDDVDPAELAENVVEDNYVC